MGPRTQATDGAAASLHPDVDALRAAYGAYRYRQAAHLVRMMPREAVRPLYRSALSAAVRGGAAADRTDPLDLLVRHCEGLLPLPSFEVWCEDVRRHPEAHLEEQAASPADAPSAERPATLDARDLEYAGQGWRAHLQAFRDGEVWRGFIAFRGPDARQEHRTAAVFCEADPTHLRSRFLSFDGASLSAFLRSSLP